MAGRVTLINGADEHILSRANNAPIVGQTVSAVVSNEAVKQVMGLDGRETFEVRSGDTGSWNSQNGSYVLRDGDSVRLSRSSGEKGIR